MIIIGAGGCVSDMIPNFIEDDSDILLFDNVNDVSNNKLRETYRILTNTKEVSLHFMKDKRFIIGVGNPINRKSLSQQFEKLGGTPISSIHSSAIIGSIGTTIESGNCISAFCFISNNVRIGKGCLINVGVSIHHDCVIGEYCEIGPGVKITGSVQIGDQVFIGSNATLVPNIKIGNKAIIGAGSVVLNDIPERTVWAGNPAKFIKALT